MSGVNPRFKHGPITYEVVEAIKGGQLVEARGAGKVGVAALNSTTVLGVANTDAKPYSNPSSTDADGFPVTTFANIPSQVTVDDSCWIPVKYGSTTAFGKALKAGAAGVVVPWVSGTDAADLIVGYCAEPAGVSTNATGIARISR